MKSAELIRGSDAINVSLSSGFSVIIRYQRSKDWSYQTRINLAVRASTRNGGHHH